MHRKIICGCIIAGALLGLNVFAATSVINEENTEVTITGNAAASENVTLMLLKPNADIDSVTASNAKEKLQRVYQTNSDSAGEYSFSVKLTDEFEVGEYTARIFKASSGSEADVETCGFYFVSESARRELTEKFNTEQDIAPYIDDLILYESIDRAILGDGGGQGVNEVYRDEIISIFKRMKAAGKTDFGTLLDVKKMFYAAAAEVQISNNANGAERAFEGLKNAGADISENDFIKYFKDIRENFGEYKTTDLGSLFKTVKTEIAVEKVNTAVRGEIRQTLADNCDILGLKDNASYRKYIALSGERSGKADAQLAGNDYKSAAAVADKLKSVVDGITSGKNTGGGSGSGGSRGTGAVNVTVESPKPVVKTDEKSACGFKDLDGCEWARDSIEMFCERGFLSGRSSETFDPFGMITRAEFVKLAVGAFGLTDGNAECSYSDCTKGDWFYEYAASAESAGLVKGEYGLFKPDEYITRQDMAVILSRLTEKCGIELSYDNEETEFADDGEISDYAKDSVYTLRSAGVMNGDENNMSGALRNASRAEAVVMLHRIYLNK